MTRSSHKDVTRQNVCSVDVTTKSRSGEAVLP
jgi:hypothetical protein